jgi:putative RNA 2'-phosphotransferase
MSVAREEGGRDRFFYRTRDLFSTSQKILFSDRFAIMEMLLGLGFAMGGDRLTKLSKYLSYHLRHAPQEIGLTLEPGGWVQIEDLLKAKRSLTRADLEQVVATCPKQRFSIEGTKIRANQGHSVEVDLRLEPMGPPEILYHGTAGKAVEIILSLGLEKMARHHVHLSADLNTARTVGSRRGKPVIFQVDAAAMDRDGFVFYRSDNNVWLTDRVPVEYLKVMA